MNVILLFWSLVILSVFFYVKNKFFPNEKLRTSKNKILNENDFEL